VGFVVDKVVRRQGFPQSLFIPVSILLTWMEGVRGLMEEKGLVEEDWNDSDEWRKKIL
jgi:hypothetical protein